MPAESPPKLNAAARLRRAARAESADGQADASSAREVELKRSRGEISCAECRRLKIRCDKSIPCQSCQRRGCASLCPNGSLATGQGTRFVLAATEHLHRRISKMSERMRELEDALTILQAKSSNQPHPLLSPGRPTDVGIDDVTSIQEEAQPGSQVATDAFGMLSISDRGASTFFGPTGGPEYLLINDNESWHSSPSADSDMNDSRQHSKSPAQENVAQWPRFSEAFPFTPLDPPQEVMDLIRSCLPPYDRALYLCQSHIRNAGWMFSTCPEEQIMDEMLPFYYKEADHPAPALDHSGAHSLALMLFILAMGAQVDPNQEPYNAEAAHYYQLARGAICLQSVWVKPTLMTIQVLHLVSIYTAMVENPLEMGDINMSISWGLLSLATQLSQTMGLHRDSARWDLPESVVTRRRLVFWNLFQADSWQSLTTGRPPSFSRTYIDCKYPRGEDSRVREIDLSDFETWFTHFAFHCVADVATKTLTAEAPSYATVMELDHHVREFPISQGAIALLEGLPPAEDSEPPDVVSAMQSFVIAHAREVLLLYIHRSFFAQALIDHPTNPVRSEYAHSYLTAYRSASVIMKIIRGQFEDYPHLCSRIWSIWTYGFSAAVVFGMVVTRGSRSPLAPVAMADLDQACDLFTRAAKMNHRAAKALMILQKLQEKARSAMAAIHPDPSAALGREESVKTEDDQDQLEIFAGRIRVSAAKQPSHSPSHRSSHSRHSQASSSSSQPTVYTPPQSRASLPSYTGVDHSADQGGWMPQGAPLPTYHVQASQSWYRGDGYVPAPPAPQFGWPNQGYPTQVLPHAEELASGSRLPAEGYRHPGQMYSGPSTLPAHSVHPAAQYMQPASLVSHESGFRETSLDARWVSFMHECCLDDANFRA